MDVSERPDSPTARDVLWRFGPMVYVAALYHPLRLAEEICMLDHLSGGRLLIGLGRGAVWIEHEMYGIERARVPQRYQESRDVLLAAQPTKKFVTVEEVAALTAFLCSQEAASITGALLAVDGGWTAQ